MKIIGVNGIHVDKEHNKNTDVMLDYIHDNSNLTTYDLNHSERWAYQDYTEKYLMRDAKELVAITKPGDIAFGHSRGALVIHKAIKLGAQFRCVFLFGAAVDNDLEWPGKTEIINMYNPNDKVLYLGSLLPFHPFGTMGLYGYKGKRNPFILNLNADVVHKVKSRFSVHSDYFLPENIGFWGDNIIYYAELWDK